MRSVQTVACALLCALFISPKLKAQTDLPANTLVTQNFNSIGSSATASLPANWKMSTLNNGGANWNDPTNITATTQAASSGTPTEGGAYNWATTGGADRAIGFMTTPSYQCCNSVLAFFRNTTGVPATSITVSYAVERYRINTDNFSLYLHWSADGITWNPVSAGEIDGAFSRAPSEYTFNSPQRVTRTVTISNLSIANNGSFYLRWFFHTGFGLDFQGQPLYSQGMGLDDVSIYANTAPVIVADLKAVLTIDNGVPNQVNPGDEITYTTKVKNIGTGNGENLVLTQPAPANTTLVPGSVKTSALASNDNYSTPLNTPLTGNTVLTNDYGIPAVNVLSFGPTANAAATAAGGSGTSNQGGTVVVNSNGTFTYTPPAGFNGVDRFAYIAGNGNLPNNDAIVTIAVGGIAPAPATDAYNVIGNVSIVPNAAAGLLANDGGTSLSVTAVNGSGANVGVATATTNGGTVIVYADGSFNYNPPAGREGSDNFTYTVSNSFGSPATSTVTLNVSGMIWFITNGGPAGDGRLGSPFNSIAAFQAVNNGSGNNPAANENIFLFESGSNYSTAVNLTLLNGQKLIGQDATATLAAITGLTPEAYSTPFPAMNTNAPTVTLITTGGNINGVTLGQNNTIRGFTISNTSGYKVFGNNFGTLTAGNTTSPDVTLNGSGGVMNLTTGSFHASSGFGGIESTGTVAGIDALDFNTVGGTLTVVTTNIINPGIYGIWVYNSSVNVNFGNTTVNGGSGIFLRQNTGGGRSFGTLNVTGLLRSFRGGIVAAGTTTVNGRIFFESVQQPVTFGATTVTGTGGIGVELGSMINGGNSEITFASLDITMNSGIALYSYGNSRVTVTNPTGSINTGGQAIYNSYPASFTGTELNLNFASVNASDIRIFNARGTIDCGTGSLSGSSGTETLVINTATISFNYAGNISQAQNSRLILISAHSTGVVNLSGNLNAPVGTGMVFDNADGTYNFTGTTTMTGSHTGINIISGSSGTFNFANSSGSFSIANTSGTAFSCIASSPTVVFKGNMSLNNAERIVSIDGATGGSINFASGTITAGPISTGILINNTDATVSFSNIIHGTSSTRTGNDAITITGGTGTYNLGNISIYTNTRSGLVATDADGTINCISGTINTTNGRAIAIDGPAGLTTLGFALTEVSSANSTTSGILIQDANGTFSVTGDNTNTNNGSGGTIQGMTQHGIYFTNPGGTGLAVTLKNMNVSGAPPTFSNILFDAPSPGSFNNSNISYCTINNATGTGVKANIQSTSGISHIAVQNCSFTGNDIGIDMSTLNASALRFDIRNNTLSGTRTQIGITGNDATPNNGTGSFMEGYIVNNNITTSSTSNLYTAMSVVANGDGTIVTNISGNTVNDFGESGIAVESRNGTGRVDATLQNNTVSGTAIAPRAAIYLRSGDGTAGETSKLYVYLTGNNANGGAGATADYYLDRSNPTFTVFAIQGLTPDPATPAQTQTFVTGTDSAPPATAFVAAGSYIAGTVNVPSF